ncbi:MAG TPA: DUF692 domain-containing protein [Halothiobacillus sp.]|nr:DUF692 domain-containing protein [Halothiobacillus sp.]
MEVHSENYLSAPALEILEDIRRDYPVSLHSVGLSLGSATRVDPEHLARITALVRRVQPALVSEHLAWGVVNHHYLADLLPLPLTEESLATVCDNVMHVQDILRRQILMENPSTYLQFNNSTIPEPEFLAALVARTGCGLICDISNIFISAHNHGWNAIKYLEALPSYAIGEYHLAGGGADETGLLIDTHDRPVAAEVWALFETALRIIGPRPNLIEWDAALPALPELLAQATIAQQYLARVSPEVHHAATG